MTRSSWYQNAVNLLGDDAICVFGDGRYALVTPCCDQIAFSLWKTQREAVEYKKRLSRLWCCGDCYPWNHYIVKLRGRS